MNQKQELRDEPKLKEPLRSDDRVGFEEMERMRREDPLFIEKTRPEDASGRAGQQTRDNVNPAIPSSEPGTGGIVDPASLGMEQGGVAPAMPAAPEPRADDLPPGHGNSSLNEPAGSNVGGDGGEPGAGDTAPTLTALDPDTAVAGDATDITLYVSGEGFTEDSVIVFGAYDEPTTLESDGTLSTGVKPSLFVVPDTVQVTVRNGTAVSGPLPFTFTGAAGDDPDELEDEIEEAKADGDIKTKPKRKR